MIDSRQNVDAVLPRKTMSYSKRKRSLAITGAFSPTFVKHSAIAPGRHDHQPGKRRHGARANAETQRSTPWERDIRLHFPPKWYSHQSCPNHRFRIDSTPKPRLLSRARHKTAVSFPWPWRSFASASALCRYVPPARLLWRTKLVYRAGMPIRAVPAPSSG